MAPIWVSALPWMVCFTFIFELKNAAEMTRREMEAKGGGNGSGEGGSAEAAVREAAPSTAAEPSGTAAAERRDSADRRQRMNRASQHQYFRQIISGHDSACTSQHQHHHSGLPQRRQHARTEHVSANPHGCHPHLAATQPTTATATTTHSSTTQFRSAPGCRPGAPSFICAYTRTRDPPDTATAAVAAVSDGARPVRTRRSWMPALLPAVCLCACAYARIFASQVL